MAARLALTDRSQAAEKSSKPTPKTTRLIGFDTRLAHGTGNTGNPSMGKQFAMSD
ncbi:hypothetical protein PPTG_22735 [Phytophthora nicotianae INRA-310]|uniref:Uncharacterized protein n=1 Tax=Phytophthora nicotianae (strain INRA-310) TaxID=761204 RepID=W2QD07_PHYN3|nr:hypothetical protein PPTG_22735 [Phytophthora nicotianae INRA-310]ETN10394.1 hypothetical protein PPTG_22735 [Phytophthora nicotianae INRA-310]